jgi:aryl-alcohol dehydrogenase-like predicted oxidoreductase
MNYRTFQQVKLSEIGLGTWQLGSADWGNVDEERSLEILNAYAELGGNFIDTADVYGMGISERVIGSFLREAKQRIYVATKLGRRSDGNFGWPQNFSYDMMKRQVESSLENLGESRLFLEQLHCIPSEELQSGKVFGNLRRLQDEGLIEHWGASVETSEEALTCLRYEGLASLQIIFNLFRQHVADEVFEKAQQHGVGIIVRVPLASGLLTGKFNAQTTFSAVDHRNYNANGESFNVGETFSGIEFHEGMKLVDELSAWLPDDRLAQWSLRWILDHPAVTTVIPGASKRFQVAGNMESSSLPPLSPEIHNTLRSVYEQKIRSQIRGGY